MEKFNSCIQASSLIMILILASSSIQLRLVVVHDASEKHDQYALWISSSAKFLSKEIEVVSTKLDGNQSLNQMCIDAEGSEIFLLSISTTPKVIYDVRRFSQMSNIPTIQVRNSISLYTVNVSVNNVTRQNLSNYVQFIRPENIFYNIFRDLMLYFNIADCAVVYDEYSDIIEILPKVFNESSIIDYQFIPMSTNGTVSWSEFGRFSNVILSGTMNNVQDFIGRAKELMEQDRINFYIVIKDIWPYMCDSCSVRRTLWIRPDIEASMRSYDKLSTFIINQMEHREWIVMHEQIAISFFYDLVNLSVVINEQLKLMFNHSSSQSNSTLNFTCEQMNKSYAGDFSLSDFIRESGMVGKFGHYNMDDAGHFYQNVISVISGINKDKKSRQIKTVGTWSILEGFQVYYGSLHVDITSISTYSIVTSHAPPFIESRVEENGTVFYRGYCFDLIEMLREELGFNYSLYLVKDSLYGAANDLGEWNGLIRDVMNGHADMAIADLSLTAERENVVDFTVPFYDLVGVAIIMRKPVDDYSLFRFMTVLTPPVWFCIVGAFFFTSFVMWLFERYNPNEAKDNKKFSLTQCMWYCMTALTPQGGPEAPNNISCKLVAATWWLFGFIIISSYTANLAAFLTVSRVESSISSLDDLAKQFKIKYAPIRGTSSEAYFRRMANIEQRFYDIWRSVSINDTMSPQERASLAVWDYPVSDKYTNMWRFMEANGLPSTGNEGYQKIIDYSSNDEGFALIQDATNARYAALADCRLMVVGGEFNRKPYAIALQQLSPLKDLLSAKILKLASERRLEELKDKWWKNNPINKNCPEYETDTSGISVKNIAGVFLVILGGLVFSMVTLVFEYFCLRTDKTKKINSKATGNKVFTLNSTNPATMSETVYP